jgi:hypothetical protein
MIYDQLVGYIYGPSCSLCCFSIYTFDLLYTVALFLVILLDYAISDIPITQRATYFNYLQFTSF